MVIPALPACTSSHTVFAEGVPEQAIQWTTFGIHLFSSLISILVGSYLDDKYSETPHPPFPEHHFVCWFTPFNRRVGVSRLDPLLLSVCILSAPY
ncbi:hypothetical protein AAFF_G00026230 [Aldrovandia affinis]|uniref:Uncharacterized protein n=1 Tax=Aldrovandia affinis TaxID=143900 RepID=A0AAD7VYF6_9TELE|nr:hypothetical protein AAFF_G00026230 [Aldrovandia affinis]